MRIYGPVPSRRFGLSLGVDVLPLKTCSFDCIYCQVGVTDCLTVERERFFSVEEIISEIRVSLGKEPTPDVITLAGSGEPTLYEPLGPLLDQLRELTRIPVLLITNGSMFHMDEVRKAANKADILAPSLDAYDEESFRRINRPHPDLSFELFFSGLKQATAEHPGQIHLEVMLIDRVNDDELSLRALSDRISELRVDRIDINTPVRPPMPSRGALPCRLEALDRAREIFGPLAQPIGDFTRIAKRPVESRGFTDRDKDIRQMLIRRPCTMDDIASSFNMTRGEASRHVQRLVSSGLAEPRASERGVYYHAPSSNPTLLIDGDVGNNAKAKL